MANKRKQIKIDKSNKYDKIIKENIENCVLPLINNFFHLDIDSSQLFEIEPVVQKTIEREADLLKKVKKNDGTDEYLLQIEFQSKNEQNMALRMLEYYGFIARKYDLIVKQYVIYIGDEPIKMEDGVNHPDVKSKFRIINIRAMDYKKFLVSSSPEYVILAILADFGKDSPEIATKNILQRIVTITETEKRYKNTLEKEKYLKQIDVISQLRGLQHIIIKTIKEMALTLDITKDLRYIEGEIIGIQKGEIIGIQKGEIIGIQKGEMISEARNEAKQRRNILKGYSKGMSIEELADFFEVSIEYVKEVINQQ